MRRNLTRPFIFVALIIFHFSPASCASAPKNLVRVDGHTITFARDVFRKEQVEMKDADGTPTDEAEAIGETIRALKDYFLKTNRNRVVEFMRRDFPETEEELTQSDLRSVPRYEALIPALKEVFEKNESPDVVYKRAVEKYGKRGFLSKHNWESWVKNVRKSNLKHQIARIEGILAKNSSTGARPPRPEVLDRRINDPIWLYIYTERLMAKDYSTVIGKNVETEGVGNVIGTYALELHKNGLFEIYDSDFEKYFWSEFPPIELKKAD